MLSFASEIPVAEEQTSDSFMGAVKEWILGSPHTQLTRDDLAEIGAAGQQSISRRNEVVSSLRAARNGRDLAAFRYKRIDEDLEWTTTVTFSRSGLDTWVSIRVFCESMHPAARLPDAKKPVVIRTLLQSLGGGMDGDLEVGQDACRFDNTEIEKAAKLIVGDSQCRLPIVYVSARFVGGYALDVSRLASDLSGMAHVVVEPNRPFSLRLKLEANSENVYGGAIGIYWPDGGGRRSFFLGRTHETPGELAKAIFDEVRIALTNRRPLERCTWASVQEMVSRQTFDQLKEAGSGRVDEYIEAFDKEVEAKNTRLEDAEHEIARLQSELRIYQSRISGISSVDLNTGSEQDFYANEIASIVIDAIKDYQGRVPSGSRREHIASALLRANSFEDSASVYRERLKELLRGFTRLDHGTRRGLEGLGFAITEDGKHYKLVFQGDDRYVFTLPKSGSDHRGGLNAASDIGRLLF